MTIDEYFPVNPFTINTPAASAVTNAVDLQPAGVAVSDRAESLARHLRRHLGDNALLVERDHDTSAQATVAGIPRREDTAPTVRREAVRPNRSERSDPREAGGVSHFGGLLDDRAGTSFSERLEAFGAAVQRATLHLKAGARRFAEHVRAYLTGERELTPGSQALKQASGRLEQSTQRAHKALKRLQRKTRGFRLGR